MGRINFFALLICLSIYCFFQIPQISDIYNQEDMQQIKNEGKNLTYRDKME
jgi:hypothetical protein